MKIMLIMMFALLMGLSHSENNDDRAISCKAEPFTGGYIYTPMQNGYQNGARVFVGDPPIKTYVCHKGQWFW